MSSSLDYWSNGFNCSESVLRALSDLRGKKVSRDLLRASTAFGLGGGGSGCECGALAGAKMFLGLEYGRTSEKEGKEIVYEKAKALHDIFKKRFGSTCCRVLNADDSKKKCKEIVLETPTMAARILSEGK